MPSYLVEVYEPRLAGEPLASVVRRAEEAAESFRREGLAVRFVRVIALPEDETCFFLYEGPTAELVGAASTHAAIAFNRIVAVEHAGPELPASAVGSPARAPASAHEGRGT